MKKILAWFLIVALAFLPVAQAGPFVSGQVLTASQLNSVVDSKTDNAAAAITGGTITGAVINNSSIGATTPNSIYSTISTAISAAGNSQGTATALTSQVNKITTGTAGQGVVLMTPARSGLMVAIDNDTAADLLIYPQVGGTIDSLSANAAMTIKAGGSVIFWSASATAWDSYLSANQIFSSTTSEQYKGLANGLQQYTFWATGTNSTNTNIQSYRNDEVLQGGAGTTVIVGYSNLYTASMVAAGTTVYGINNSPTVNTPNTPTSIFGITSGINFGAAALGGTVANVFINHAAAPTINAATTTNVTNWYQNFVGTVGNGASQTITNAYGYYSNMTAASGRWGFVDAGGANNAFAGNVRIGSTVAPTVALDITGSLKVSGLITPTSASGIVGTTTNDNAQAGSFGEYTSSSVVATTVSLTTATPANMTTLSLTAGDWDVSGACTFTAAATTSITASQCGISTTSATFGADGTYVRDTFAAVVPGAVEWKDHATPMTRISIAGTTTVYLVAQSTFTVSTQTAGGFIRARRVR